MTGIKEFSRNFGNYKIPQELQLLFEFQDEHGEESYSECFALIEDGKEGLKTYSEEPDFLNALMPFAQANGSGSSYALWMNKKTDNLSTLPVVVFGDEGGSHIVAENVKDLLKILSYDCEPMVDYDEVSFYKDEDDHEPSDSAEEFHDWLQKNFDIEPVEDPMEVVDRAQEKYQEAFEEWRSRYVDSFDDFEEDDEDDED